MATLKEHHIMCVEELARNRSIRKIASTFEVDESTLRRRLGRKRTDAENGRTQPKEAWAKSRPNFLRPVNIANR